MATTRFATVILLLLCSVAVQAKIDNKCSNGANNDWDKCDGLCCQPEDNNKVVRGLNSDGTVSSCCTDNHSGGCPDGTQCCSPGSSSTNAMGFNDNRYCYFADTAGCCTVNVYDPAAGTTKPGATTYNLKTEKCCAQAKIWKDDYNGDASNRGTDGNNGGAWNGIVPFGETCFFTSNNDAPHAECASDSDCSVGNPAVAGKCCRRARNADTGETDSQYNHVRGRCYDPETEGCCENTAEDTGDQSKTENMAVVYTMETQKCCKLNHQVMGIDERCNCQTDAQCDMEASGSVCCTRDSASVAGALQCADTCGTVNGGRPAGCMGTCTIPRLHDVCFDTTCKGFNDNDGDNDGILTDQPTAKCCKSADETIVTPRWYQAHSQVCCPRGAGGSAVALVQNQETEGPLNFVQRCRCLSDRDCPSSQKCCGNSFTSGGVEYGQCYDAGKEACCNHSPKVVGSSEIYATASAVCCSVNGVQSYYSDCKCSGDSQCPSGGVCCVDAEFSSAHGWVSTKCDATDSTLCPGTCTWGEINECCDNPHKSEGAGDVARCNKKYQKCCDGECCNKFSETCKKSKRQQEGHPDPWGYDEDQKRCTWIEHRTPTITFNAFVFPAFLTLISLILIGLSVVKGLESVATPTILKFVVIGLAVFCGLMSCLLLWSPVWKYGFVVVIANAILLGSLTADNSRARMLAGLVILTSFLYLVDPIGGNSVLTMDGGAVVHTSEDAAPRGLQSAVMIMHNRNDGYRFRACTNFYGYFEEDSDLEDYRRENPHRQTRSLCGAGWLHTIAIISGLLIVFQSLLVVLGLILIPSSGANGAVAIAPAPAKDSA